MIKFTKIPNHINLRIPHAIDYHRSSKDVIFAYLFGSLVKGIPGDLSDIDIAVYLHDNLDIAEKKVQILGTLNDILETDEIDLVILNTAPVSLQIKIIEKKRILVDKEPFIRHRFESLVMRKYLDFSLMESAILYRRFLHG
jgi:predicted nucleotidyltransferase